MLHRVLPLLALLLAIAIGAPAEARRVALVVGNGAYRHLPPLANPARDARAVGAQLAALGFAVETLLDADRPGLLAAIDRLAAAAADAEAALLFYAGHAVEIGGQNWVLPVTVRPRAADLEREALRYDEVERRVGGRAGTTLVFLDACRDNPMVGQAASAAPATPPARAGRATPPAAAATPVPTRSVGAGLAGNASPPGMLLAFATAPGRVALDGDGDNSPFTTALLQHIATPDLELRQMLGRVRRAVREATGGQQIPWDNSSLEGEFFFASTVPTAPIPRPAATPPAPVTVAAPRPPVSSAPEEVREVSGAAFLERIRGNTFQIVVQESRFGGAGDQMEVYVRPDSRLVARYGPPARRRLDTGESWLDNGQYCSQWKMLRRGFPACWRIFRDGESYSAQIGDSVRIEFSIRQGDPYGLAR
jgi:uncharacterized caspase-like protein